MYQVLRKTRADSEFRIMERYCPTLEYANKIIELYKRRKIVRVGETVKCLDFQKIKDNNMPCIIKLID